MDALQELRIKAEMARSLGHDLVAQGIEEAMKTLGAQSQAVLSLPAPAAAPPEPINARRRWLPADNAELIERWNADEPIPEISEKMGRGLVAVASQAIYVLKLTPRPFDLPVGRYREMVRAPGGR